MARLGAGTVAYLSLNDDANKVMADYYERIAHPALSDISVDLGSMQASDVFPKKIPDLFVGRPVVITGRFKGQVPDTICVRGKIGGVAQEIAVKTSPTENGTKNALPAVWARAKIADLSDDALGHPELVAANPDQIKQVALEYGLMSAYTSFVAVDSSQVTKGDHGTTVNVPVPVPDGVRYDTTVMEGAKEARHVE
jgi:Ca-activated chloride channel family protein